jgi:polysaccharide export outer membrane protein
MFKKKTSIQFFLSVILFFSTLVSSNATFAQDTSSYLIGPSDLLYIYVWKETELTQEVTVLPDGNISFPLIGEIQAQGRNVTELKSAISTRLKHYVTAPEVTVVVRQTNSRRIYTLGKLNRPAPYPLMPDMTVLQALSTAGGLAEWADEKNIFVIRREGARDLQLRFNYKDYISGKNLEQNILLKPNDTIVVP